MSMNRVLGAAVAALALLTLTTGPARTQARGGQTKDAPTSEAKIRALLKDRLAALKQIAEETEKLHQAKGATTFDDVLQARLAYLHAELDLCDNDKERVAVLDKMLTLAKESERMVGVRFDMGSIPHTAVLAARVNRLEAEIALERAKAKAAAK